jgi:peptide/nickel transport system substrate-binding protein
MRKYVWVCAALALAVLVTACGGGGKGPSSDTASTGGAGSSKTYRELRLGMGTWAGGLDWIKVPWGPPQLLEALVAPNLVEAEPNGTVRKSGYMASNRQLNPTTYVYKLKPGIKFSDGTPVTASDVVFSLKRNVVGKEAWMKSYWEDVASIDSRGPSTVVVKLKHPDAVWQDIMSVSSPITERAQAEKVGEAALGTPGHLEIGAGPWKFDSFTPESQVRLSRNPYWTGPTQPATEIVVNVFKEESTMALAMRSGGIDGAFLYSSRKLFANIPGTRQLEAPGGNLAMLQMNTTVAPFDDVHVRRAIAYATDTKGIVNALYHGTSGAAEDVTIAPNSLFAGLGSASEVNAALGTVPKYDFSLASAKQELARSQYPHGFSTKVQALTNEPSMVAVAQIVASDLAKIGIKAEVQEIPPDENASMYGKKLDIWANEYGSTYPDPESLMSDLLPPSQINLHAFGLNDANYRNAEVDKLQAQELETLQPSKRLQLIGKLLGIVATEVPYVPLYTHAMFAALSTKYVFPNFSNWITSTPSWVLDIKLAS